MVVMAAVAGLEAALGDTLAKAVAARGRASAYMAMESHKARMIGAPARQ